MGALGLTACAVGPSRQTIDVNRQLGDIEARIGGRLGVSAIDTQSGARISWRGGERFAMASTFKLALAALTLSEVDAGRLSLDQKIEVGSADLLAHAPVVETHIASGSMTLAQLCEAAVTVSDNAAANLLLRQVGGPEGLTRFFRARGDRQSRLDRIEPELNENRPGDLRDTTTPDAMSGFVQSVCAGGGLGAASQALLNGWLEACSTGKDRLRAGLPTGWRAGDKTGTGANGAVNDIAIAWPPGRRPVILVCYASEGPADTAAKSAAHAEVARLIARNFAG